jgi:hypothetical protein
MMPKLLRPYVRKLAPYYNFVLPYLFERKPDEDSSLISYSSYISSNDIVVEVGALLLLGVAEYSTVTLESKDAHS